MPETTTTLERAIDQGVIDLETGEFPLVLATPGETTETSKPSSVARRRPGQQADRLAMAQKVDAKHYS